MTAFIEDDYEASWAIMGFLQDLLDEGTADASYSSDGLAEVALYPGSKPVWPQVEAFLQAAGWVQGAACILDGARVTDRHYWSPARGVR